MMVRGRKSRQTLLEELRAALQLRDDPIALQDSPLADMHVVRSRAERQFGRRTCGSGLALSAVLHEVLRDIAADLGEQSIVSRIAEMLHAGATQASIARAMGISDEHFSRRWKPVLLNLVLQRLQLMNREVAELPAIADNRSPG